MSRSATWRRVLVALGATTALVAVLPAPASSAAQVNCSAGRTYVWDGAAGDPPGAVGDGVSWNDANNWDINCTPGLPQNAQGQPKPQTDVVTIPAGASVVLAQGEQAVVGELTNNGALTVAAGAVFSVRQASTSAHLELRGLLYGPGSFTVTGTLDAISGEFAASMSTRRCGTGSAQVDCSSAAPTPGRTVIAQGATMTVSGGGLNLGDQRIIDNRGHVVIADSSYVAADRGTTFRNLRLSGAPAPVLEFTGDGDYDQGLLTAGQSIGRFLNTGSVLKSGGTGRSVIDAAYSTTDSGTSATGTVTVRSGTLDITSVATTSSATVRQGAGFGTLPDKGTTSNDPQAVKVALTKPGTTSSTVTIAQLPPGGPTGHGDPVQISTPSAVATAAAPLRFRLYLDAALLGSAHAADIAASAPVYRKADDAMATYYALPDCGPSGPGASVACVDRSQSTSETSALTGNDVVLVVESLSNSRYKVG